jgi:hypothetical protein
VKGKIEMGGAPDSAGDAVAAANAAAKKAYELRSRALSDAWRRRNGKAPTGPWFKTADAARIPPKVSADWAASSGGQLPAAGGSGRSPYSSHRMSDGERAWNARNEWLANAWKAHRKPHVPGDPA